MDTMNLELNLSEKSKELFGKLTIDEVVLLVRHNDFPPFHDAKKAIDYDRKFNFRRKPKIRNDLKQLGSEVRSELNRLGMIRTDFYDSDRFRMSANIVALRQMIAEKSRRAPSYYYNSAEYIDRLIRRLDNETYENWQGYNDNTIAEIKELLRKTLTDTEYVVICMRFGLDDGRCCDWQEISQRFGWTSKGGPAYHEQNAIGKLYGALDKLKELTKLS